MSNALEQLMRLTDYVKDSIDYEEPERYPPQPRKTTKELDPKKWKKRQLQKQARTEADILKDFEKLGLVIAKNDDFELILIDDCDRMIAIYKTLKRYDCYYFSEGYKPLQLSTDITMQEHKLLNELFNLWGWL